MFNWIKMNYTLPSSPNLATQSIKMLYKPHDENDNQLEIEIPKSESVNNRRFHWPNRKRFALEIGFYSMTLLATIFLLTIVYILTKRSLDADHYKCPTVTILKPKEDKLMLVKEGIVKRTYPDPSDPLYALCGPCPKLTCPECPKAPHVTCPPCVSASSESSCSTPNNIETTCPPCLTYHNTNQSNFYNETYHLEENSVTATTMTDSYSYTEDSKIDNLCLTRNCIIQASDILKMIDSEAESESTQFCKSFTTFSCHGLILSPSSSSVTLSSRQWMKTKESNQQFDDQNNFHAVLSEMTSTHAKEKPVIREIWNFYQSCLNEDAIERKGKEPLKEVINSMGGWPLLELGSTCLSAYDLTETMIKTHQLGTLNSMIFSFDLNVFNTIDSSTLPSTDSNYITTNGNDNINMLISSASLGMGSPGPYIAKKWGSYYEIMIDTALKLGASKQSALKSMNQVLEFETKLAQIAAREEMKPNQWTTINLFQMNMIFPSIEWPKYLKVISGSNLSGDEKINVTSIEMLKQINELLTVTDKSVICDYILWRIILDSLPRLNRFWRQLYFNSIKSNQVNHNFANAVDQQQLIPRKETCDSQLISYFHNLLPLIYYKEHFNSLETIKFKSLVNHLADTTINTLSKMISSNLNIINQVQSMKDYINDIHQLIASNAIESIFKELKLSESDYFNNMLEITKFTRKSIMASLKSTDASILRYLLLDNKFLKQMKVNSKQLLIILSRIINSYQALTDLSFLNYSTIGLDIMFSLFSSLQLTNHSNPFEPIGPGNLSAINIINDQISCKLSRYNHSIPLTKSAKRQLTVDYLIYTIIEKSFISDNQNNSDHNLFLPGLDYDINQLFYLNLAKTLCTKNKDSIVIKDGKLIAEPLKRFDFILNQLETFKGSFGCQSNESSNCDESTNGNINNHVNHNVTMGTIKIASSSPSPSSTESVKVIQSVLQKETDSKLTTMVVDHHPDDHVIISSSSTVSSKPSIMSNERECADCQSLKIISKPRQQQPQFRCPLINRRNY